MSINVIHNIGYRVHIKSVCKINKKYYFLNLLCKTLLLSPKLKWLGVIPEYNK